ncbi:UDP-GlcNAcbetaGal beta-13-N-acetylglucosaminyltransferase 9 [Cricetulus griseus]
MRRRLRFCRDAWLTLLLSAALGLLLYAQRDGAAPTTRAPPARGQSPRGPLLVSGDAGSPTTPARPRRPMRATPQCRPHLRAPLTSADICAPRINGASRCSLTNRVNAAETAHLAARRICSSRSSLWPPTSSGGKPGIDSGRAGTRTHWRALLEAESRAYADILLWAFEDTFFNLTLKEIHFLAWASAFCPDVRFVFKGDADVFVHVRNLLQFLEPRDPAQDLLAGDVIVQARPIRSRASKYFIPEAVYGLPVYPAYAGGGGFVLSGATLRRLAEACSQVELFPIDDVFLGMCLQRLRLTPEPHPAFRTFGIAQPSAAPHLRTFDPCFYRELVVVHGLSAADIWLMWRLLHGPRGPVCAHPQPVATGPFQWNA